ncbi:MAG TPA: class I SAM-dependent methyltransferase [Terracidiphilus sp.]|jgi:SAM-dependent methyltransferase|nr:class I SAM-dependent methyltransferase [Terracidiphilus sp.]
MAAMAILHGLAPAPVERCRVLEIACGDGSNLIPMAYALPSSEFVGFDLAQSPIERGQARAAELGLSNLRLFQGDLLDAGQQLGPFDYIVAHGFYSWVPAAVRERLLAVCQELLTENGIAFISYNALPGGQVRTMLREMMLFSAADVDDPEGQVREGLDFLRVVCAGRAENDAFRAMLESQIERMAKRPVAATLHDEFGAVYYPVRVLDFAAHANRYGLQYVCEAELPPAKDPSYRADVQVSLDERAAGDFLKREQLLDYLRMRSFRQSLLCRTECAVQRDYPADSLQRLSLASSATEERDSDTGVSAFVLPSGARMELNHPGFMALLRELTAAWPGAMPLQSLEPQLESMGLPLAGDGKAWLIRLAIARMVEFRAWNPPVARQIGPQPRASACSRQEGRSLTQVATLLHLTIGIEDEKARYLLSLLDGSRNRGALLDAMRTQFPDLPREKLEEGLEPALGSFHHAGVFEA